MRKENIIMKIFSFSVKMAHWYVIRRFLTKVFFTLVFIGKK